MILSQLTQRAWGTIAGLFSASNLPSFLAILILILANTQLGYHFWPNSTLVYGIRVDYLAPTIYLLDTLILAYLVATRSVLKGSSAEALAKEEFEASSPKMSPKRTDLVGHFLSAIFPIFLTNLIFSVNPTATLNWSLHFILYFIFISSPSPIIIRNLLLKILPPTMFFQVALASIQVFLGHTLQGPLYYLGERAISIATPNAARATVFGQTVLRAYGTFSHPNILAGWLVMALLIVIYLNKQRHAHVGSGLAPARSLVIFSTLLTALGVILTQSRTSALVLFGIIIPFYILPRQFIRTRTAEIFTYRVRQLSPRLLYFFSLSLVTCYLLFTSAFSRVVDTSLTDRLHLQGVSSQIIRTFPIFGTGASASISTYPDISPTTRLLQPDHNSFTLLISWFGIFGVVSLLVAFSLLGAKRRSSTSVAMSGLLPLLLLDHYFLTSSQGLFILLLYLRVTISSCRQTH